MKRHMDLALASLSRTIDSAELGRRLRAARVAAGLTQAQVAEPDVTAAYLSRIEDGQRRPAAGLLVRMADRMGVTLDDLLRDVSGDEHEELRLAVDHAELSLASGDPDAALSAAEDVLAYVAAERAPDVVRAARRVRAGALESIGEIDGAIAALEELLEGSEPDAGWIGSLAMLCRCHLARGDLVRAIAAGEQATQLVESLGLVGLPESVSLAATVAAIQLRHGEPERAMRTCLPVLEEAVRRAEPGEWAAAYRRAGEIEAERGSTAAAIGLTRKALALYERGDELRDLARLRCQAAELRMLQDPPAPEAALETLAGVDAPGASAACPLPAEDRALVHLLRGRAYLLLGDHDAARSCATRVTEERPPDASVLEARGLILEGRIDLAEGHRTAAHGRFRTGVRVLAAARADRGTAPLWLELANLLADVGDNEGAVRAFRSAAVS